MIRRTVTVTLENGLHMMPASEIAKSVQGFRGRVVLRRAEIVADAHSMLDLLQLTAEYGTTLEVEADGDGADSIVDAIARLFAMNFAVERPAAPGAGASDK